jgi:hypothetical protein
MADPAHNFTNLIPNAIFYRNTVSGQEHHWSRPLEPARLTHGPQQVLIHDSQHFGLSIYSQASAAGVVGLPESAETNIIVTSAVAEFIRTHIPWRGVILVPDVGEESAIFAEDGRLLGCSRFIRYLPQGA